MLICSPYKFFGPHLGVAFAPRELLERWRPYKVRPAADEPLGKRFETGTLPVRAARRASSRRCEYIESLGWDAIVAHERALGERFLAGLPDGCRLYGLPTMDGRVPTFCFTSTGSAPRRRRRGSASAASRSGTATTTRSR